MVRVLDRVEVEVAASCRAGGRKGSAWRYLLLSVFCLGVFVDVLNACVFYILLTPVASTLQIAYEQQTWIITSYTITFSSFLLVWGRVSDLYSPKPVFCYGFLALGGLNLIISFLTDKFSFLIIRAVSGIAGACLVPSSYRLIGAVFEQHELSRAFTVYSLSGALGASFGVQIGGLVELIPLGGQMLGWRWYFRIVAAITIPVSLWSLKYFPHPKGAEAGDQHKWNGLDIVGSATMLAAVLLLILGLNMGASLGWRSIGFLLPFILSLALFPAFFWWESRLPSKYALIPPMTWKYPNFTLWMVLATFTSAWWTCSQVWVIELFVNKYGDSPIIASLRILPSGGFSFISAIMMVALPILNARPRWSYTVGQAGGMVAYGLFILSEGRTGAHYWKYFFPGMSMGSFLNNVSTTCVVVGAMMSAPSEQAGVAGAILQTAVQAGNTIGLTIQDGLMTIHPGGIDDFRNVAASFYFIIAWGGSWLLLFWCFFRPRQHILSGHVVVH